MKRLERSRSHRIVQGVCGGVGEYFGIDADVVRVVWILSVLCGGIGVIPYLVAIFLLPEGEERPEVAPSTSGARILGLALIALAGFFFLRAFGIALFGARVFAFWTLGILLPLALLVAGAFLVWPRAREAVGFSGDRKPRRSVSDRVLAGVAGGIARELDTDANLVRLAFVLVGVLTSGFALLIYLLLVVILPEEEALAPAAPMAPATPPTPAAPPEAPASPASPAPPVAAAAPVAAASVLTAGGSEAAGEPPEPPEEPGGSPEEEPPEEAPGDVLEEASEPDPGAQADSEADSADEAPDQDEEADRR